MEGCNATAENENDQLACPSSRIKPTPSKLRSLSLVHARRIHTVPWDAQYSWKHSFGCWESEAVLIWIDCHGFFDAFFHFPFYGAQHKQSWLHIISLSSIHAQLFLPVAIHTLRVHRLCDITPRLLFVRCLTGWGRDSHSAGDASAIRI